MESRHDVGDLHDLCAEFRNSPQTRRTCHLSRVFSVLREHHRGCHNEHSTIHPRVPCRRLLCPGLKQLCLPSTRCHQLARGGTAELNVCVAASLRNRSKALCPTWLAGIAMARWGLAIDCWSTNRTNTVPGGPSIWSCYPMWRDLSRV